MTRNMLLLFLLPVCAFAVYMLFPGQKLPKGKVIDVIRVYKKARRMKVYSNGELLKTYTIALGKNPLGHKQFEGDCKTPEGTYIINDRNPNSRYHKNLGISYPNASDTENARKLGKPPGGAIKIHGLPNGKGFLSKLHRQKDWTAGCIAVTNAEIDELYGSVKENATITIYP